jgi:enoyl-CoA hydratase/carnithine racemase
MPAKILCDQADGVARVTLSYPKRFNAMSRAMWRELRTVFERIQQQNDVRCVLVVGQGANFCAGGDISEYSSFRFEEASLREFHEEDVWGALNAMLQCDVPMVARIVGNCMGAGIEIASCCDIRLAAESAKFGAPIARLGFPMAPREAALVVRELGGVTARQMLLEAAVFSAPEMLQRGFLSRVVADVDLHSVVQATLDRIAHLAPQAARLNKQTLRALNPLLSMTNKALAAAETVATSDPVATLLAGAFAYASGAEHREGVNAFLEKRPPKF